MNASTSSAASTVTVSVEEALPESEIERFHDLYEEAFAALRTRAIGRQVLRRAEFHAEMTDPRIQKHVARSAAGQCVGLTTLTRDLATVPWISPDYFAARYPQHAERNAIFYAGFTLVAPSARQGAAFHAMIKSVVQVLTTAGAVVGWDICSYGNSRFSFADALRSALGEQANAEVAVEDSQIYYAARFTGVGSDKGG